MKHRVIIVGSGPGGLTSGMILAHRGYQVTILEKAAVVGGRNSKMRVGEYTFDTGPTFLHQKFTLDEVFAEAGRKADEELDFVKLDPMTRLSWGDIAFDTSSDPKKMEAEIERVFPGEGKNYRRFMDYHAEKLKALFPCLSKPYHSFTDLFRMDLFKALPYVATTKSVMEVLGEYFKDERLRLAFTFQAKYLGMSPWKCPALFSILAYIEYAHGIFHTKGGLAEISETMARVFVENGGDLRLNTGVEEILFDGDRAKGVILESGEKLECDTLFVNADYAYARSELFGEHAIEPEKLKKKKFSCSTFMMYLGLDKIYPDEPHHHVMFADNYQKNVEDIHAQRELSDDISVYVRNSSINDPTVAPEGHSQLYVLVPTINLRYNNPWEEQVEAYKEKVLDTIVEKTGMKDLREHIVAERCLTPRGWEESGIFMGATFNLAHTMDQLLHLRPQNRLKGFENVYLVGGGTHPGSGLPTIFEGARISVNLLEESLGQQPQRVDYTTEALESVKAVSA